MEASARSDFWDDPQKAQQVMARLAGLKDKVEAWRAIEAEANELSELFELAGEEGDEAFVQDLTEQLAGLASRLEERELSLALSGEYDHRDAIMAIHAGAGGTDSMDWAQMLLRMYLRWLESRGYKTSLIDLSPGEEAGLKSATVEVGGANAFGYLKAERGVHRLVRISPFDSSHARHTSFALVEAMPVVESATEVEIDSEDLRIDVFRSSGKGGQNVQKNATAVRITHIPSGITVSCQNERSLQRNKDFAMKVLSARLLEREIERKAKEQANVKGQHVSAEWGNQIRSYVLHPYKMVKDHRTGYETSDAEAVLDGSLDAFVQAYQKESLGQQR